MDQTQRELTRQIDHLNGTVTVLAEQLAKLIDQRFTLASACVRVSTMLISLGAAEEWGAPFSDEERTLISAHASAADLESAAAIARQKATP